MLTQLTATNTAMNILPSAQSEEKERKKKIRKKQKFLGEKLMLVFKTRILAATVASL